ncbi:MAG: HD domain-containing protein [Acholeplasmatales bacterium]|nr:HD domain-containing protein [Acholeplasmatales bacterium]
MLIVGKVSGINTSDNQLNIQICNKDGITYNLKISSEEGSKLVINNIYEFSLDVVEGERTYYIINEFKNVNSFEFEKKNDSLRSFFEASPLSLKELEDEIEKYQNKIENKIIKDITVSLISKNHDNYFLYPAASRMHHAYIGGLAYHSIGMLHLADGIINAYPFLDKDYLYAGIMLHDIGKIKELTGIITPEYSKEGQLLGHLVIGAMEIHEEAINLGYKDKEEALLLEHMLISHHGMPQFGSAKKPLTAEALALWNIDNIDSKLRVLEEEYKKIQSGEFTTSIGVLYKLKMYKA